LLLSLHPEYVMYHTVWPVGINKCTVKCSWLFSKEIVKSNKYTTEDAIDFWDKTNKQDWAICELSYLGIQSKKYEPAPYSGQESLLAAYDNYYLQHFKK
jgi:Rieske 2Fe-2S family protein